MDIQLTPQQQQALDTQAEGPTRIIDPRTNVVYILVPETDYESIREIIEDEHRQQALHAVALQNAVGRMNEVP